MNIHNYTCTYLIIIIFIYWKFIFGTKGYNDGSPQKSMAVRGEIVSELEVLITFYLLFIRYFIKLLVKLIIKLI